MIVQVVVVCSAPSETGDWKYCWLLMKPAPQPVETGHIFIFVSWGVARAFDWKRNQSDGTKWQAHITHCKSTAWSSEVLTIGIHFEASLQSCQWLVEYLISPWLLAPSGFENLHFQGIYMLNVHLLLSVVLPSLFQCKFGGRWSGTYCWLQFLQLALNLDVP